MKIALAVVVAVLAASASPARAATLSVTGTAPNQTIVYQSEPGRYDFLDVTEVGAAYVEFRAYSGITAGPGCTVVDTTADEEVDCSDAGVTSVEIDLGDQDDTLSISGGGDFPVVAHGGPGNDSLDGGKEADTFYGDAGNDTLGDQFSGATDPSDSYSGGDGVDTVNYANRGDALNISLDDVANDGAAGEDDNVASDIETIWSGTGADTITGDDEPNTIEPGPGADHVDGRGGDDVIADNSSSGGCGGNVLEGGDGNDTISSWGGADSLSGGPGDDKLTDQHSCSDQSGGTFSGGSGTDVVAYQTYSWDEQLSLTLDGVANDGDAGENDLIETDVEGLQGGYGPDHLVGDSGPNMLDGGQGNDLIEGGGGNDTLDGLWDQDTLLGQAGDDTLNGGPGDDVLDGGADEDTLNGDAGDDVLDGGLGGDTLSGGDDQDVADYSTRSAPVTVDMDGQSGDDGELGEGDTVGTDVEDIWGGSGDDHLTGNASDNVFDGGPGADDFHGLGGEDVVDYSGRSASVNASIDGVANDGEAGEGDNIGTDVEDIWGGSGDDVLAGGAGDNILDGGPGADHMTGGGGTDGVDYSTRTADVTVDLDGSPGNDGEAGEGDTVGADIEGIIGGSGNDTLTGNAADGFLYGNDGNDRLTDPGGQDEIDGGDGNDELQTRDGAEDSDVCGDGFDSVVGDANDDLPYDDCESVEGPVSPPTGGGGGGGGGGGAHIPPPHPPHAPRLPRPRPITLVDHTPPKGSLALASRLRLGTLRSHGLRVTVSCNEPCSVAGTLTATFIGHRARKASRITLARATLSAGPAGRRALKLALSRRGKRALRRATTVRARLSVLLTDTSGNARRLSRSLVFRR